MKRRPVVASRVGGIPEIVTSRSLGSLVAPMTAEALAQEIDRLVRLPEAGRQMGRAGADSLRGRFDPGTVAVQWRDLYAGLLATRRRRVR